VRVARLDGPTAGDAMMLVDRAVAAERTGLLGRAYVDLSDRDPVGNAWLEAAARQLGELGFDPAVDRAPATMAAGARFDAPVIYFGWYSGNIDGPFLLPGFQFPTGAIALHIHSYSALTLRSATSGWTGPFVARGVTATVGNVNEPYLAFTHQPQLLLRALARGQTLAEAAYFALQALSWQAILIGDPLYRRFAVPLSAKLEKTAVLPRGLAGYAVAAPHARTRRRRKISRGHRARPGGPARGAVARRRRGARGAAAQAGGPEWRGQRPELRAVAGLVSVGPMGTRARCRRVAGGVRASRPCPRTLAHAARHAGSTVRGPLALAAGSQRRRGRRRGCCPSGVVARGVRIPDHGPEGSEETDRDAAIGLPGP
jgi:hypothetical protein